LKEGKDIAVITLGPIGVQAKKAYTTAEQEKGKTNRIAEYPRIHPRLSNDKYEGV